jgi:hypothetical protein
MEGMTRLCWPLSRAAVAALAALAALPATAAAGGWHVGPAPGVNAQFLAHVPADGRADVCLVDSGVMSTRLTDGAVLSRHSVTNAGAEDSSPNRHGTAMAHIGLSVWGGLQLHSVQVTDANGAATSAEVAAGIRACAALDAGVVSLSMGGRMAAWELAEIADAVMAAQTADKLVVVAAGNAETQPDGSGGASDIARIDGVLSVGGSGRRGGQVNDPARRTADGARVDVVAPGENIPFTDIDGYTSWESGTSTSTVIVAAAAGALRQLNPAVRAAQLRRALIETATTGALVDIHRAAEAVGVQIPAAQGRAGVGARERSSRRLPAPRGLRARLVRGRMVVSAKRLPRGARLEASARGVRVKGRRRVVFSRLVAPVRKLRVRAVSATGSSRWVTVRLRRR